MKKKILSIAHMIFTLFAMCAVWHFVPSPFIEEGRDLIQTPYWWLTLPIDLIAVVYLFFALWLMLDALTD